MVFRLNAPAGGLALVVAPDVPRAKKKVDASSAPDGDRAGEPPATAGPCPAMSVGRGRLPLQKS